MYYCIKSKKYDEHKLDEKSNEKLKILINVLMKVLINFYYYLQKESMFTNKWIVGVN